MPDRFCGETDGFNPLVNFKWNVPVSLPKPSRSSLYSSSGTTEVMDFVGIERPSVAPSISSSTWNCDLGAYEKPSRFSILGDDDNITERGRRIRTNPVASAGRKSPTGDKEKVCGMTITSFLEQSTCPSKVTNLHQTKIEQTTASKNIEFRRLCSFRKKSPDDEFYLSYDGNPGNLDNEHLDKRNVGPGPNNRWVKRLRLPSMDSFALGTKSCTIDVPSSRKRVQKLFTRVLNYNKTISDMTLRNCLEHHHSGKSILFSGNEDSPVEALKNSTWIRRWCLDDRKAAKSKVTSASGCHQIIDGHGVHKVRNKTASCENGGGKLFPSITAMALMGKSASNFQPCEFKRKGPSIVWTT